MESLHRQGWVCGREFRMHSMFDPFDAWTYELCFPGAISGSTEIDCPHCGTTLTVAVDDPMGSQVYRCPECQTMFKVNWGE